MYFLDNVISQNDLNEGKNVIYGIGEGNNMTETFNYTQFESGLDISYLYQSIGNNMYSYKNNNMRNNNYLRPFNPNFNRNNTYSNKFRTNYYYNNNYGNNGYSRYRPFKNNRNY